MVKMKEKSHAKSEVEKKNAFHFRDEILLAIHKHNN